MNLTNGDALDLFVGLILEEFKGDQTKPISISYPQLMELAIKAKKGYHDIMKDRINKVLRVAEGIKTEGKLY